MSFQGSFKRQPFSIKLISGLCEGHIIHGIAIRLFHCIVKRVLNTLFVLSWHFFLTLPLYPQSFNFVFTFDFHSFTQFKALKSTRISSNSFQRLFCSRSFWVLIGSLVGVSRPAPVFCCCCFFVEILSCSKKDERVKRLLTSNCAIFGHISPFSFSCKIIFSQLLLHAADSWQMRTRRADAQMTHIQVQHWKTTSCWVCYLNTLSWLTIWVKPSLPAYQHGAVKYASEPPRTLNDSWKRRHHNWLMEHKNTKSCRETQGTNTQNGQVQMEPPWTLWNEMEELWRNSNRGRTQSLLQWKREYTRAWRWISLALEFCLISPA